MKIRKNELLFSIGIIILAIRSIINASLLIEVDNMINSILLFVAYFCFFLNIIINKLNYKELRNLCLFS